MKIDVLSFSGIYESEGFYKELEDVRFLDLKDISGTNCMCDDAARDAIMAKLSVPRADLCSGSDKGISFTATCEYEKATSVLKRGLPYGLHFIDSGNYHYISALYSEMIKEPFSLVVLDHHPDMQRPMFDILSCGGWVLEVLDKNPYVRDVHIIGAAGNLIEELAPDDRNRVHFYDRVDPIHIPVTEYPIFLSIDKDVISRNEIVTNWDQGDAGWSEVLGFTKALLKRNVLAIDVCGECAPDQAECDLDKAIAQNDDFNKKVAYLVTGTTGIR